MSSLHKSTDCHARVGGRRLGPAGLVVLVVFVSVSGLFAAFSVTPALAEVQSPQWTVTAFSIPTNLAPGSTGKYTVEVKNTGGAPSNGATIDISDTLPSGLSLNGTITGQEFMSGNSVSCTGAACTYSGVIVSDDAIVLMIPVEVAVSPPQERVTNLVSVSGGGAHAASVETPSLLSSTPAGFGIAPGSMASTLSSTQAGAHPDLTVAMSFNSIDTSGKLSEPPRSVLADLPPGFAGDLADSPTCSVARFSEISGLFVPQPCPLSTQVGTTTLAVNFPEVDYVTVPVYNLTPNPGEVAKLGFEAVSFGVQGTVSLRPGDYGVRTAFQNIIESAGQLDSTSLTVWGVPAAASHDAMRGLVCNGFGNCSYTNPQTGFGEFSEFPNGQPVTSPGVSYLTSPTQCTGAPLQVTLTATAWEGSGGPASVQSPIGPMTGCDLLEFTPSITTAPDTTHADTPAGLTADVKVPQEGLVSPEGLSTADIKNTTVTLPPGLVINPGQANGLEACQPSQEALGVEGPASCPNGSKVGQDEIRTPLLKEKLEGNVYVLVSDPPDVKLLVTAYAPIYGIYVKLVGDVRLDTSTGQLTTTFNGTPELPFTDFKLSFSGGAQAALVTPTGCGTYSTNADFAPWSGESDALVTSLPFAIESGPGGSACASPLPFAPSLIAGATTDQAGGFTDFSLLLQRADGQQRISSLRFKTPEGLSGMISKVPLCGEPQASLGTCSTASQIGHAVVEAGPGPDPLVVPQPGSSPAPIYLTGGYRGAPYGLSIVVPLVVGPFNLGTIVTRARIEVDPLTTQLTVTTDPFPSIIDGVPADLRTINAVIDRPGFMFNPTNCNPQSFSGTALSTEGATAPLSSHFQVGSCQSLAFKPRFTVSTSGKTSKANGASLKVKLAYPNAPQGAEANIHSVKVDLPKQLPSRLTTLQKACTAAQFEANPAGCPAASIVGHAKATTPLLPVPVEGPAYFVSHGGEAFPSLILVLQGYGVTVDLVGTTFISKAGITSSTFKTVPDVPVGSFELTLPQGKFSALAANGNLCKATRTVRRRVARRANGRVVHVQRTVTKTVPQPLLMPTGFVAQNGAQFSQTTKIAVTGCPKVKAKKALSSHNHGKGKATKKLDFRGFTRPRGLMAIGVL